MINLSNFERNKNKIRFFVNKLRSAIFIPREFPGFVLELKLNTWKKPMILRDWAGFNYWQYPGPDQQIRFNWKRKSVTDATHIVRYILKNVKTGWTCIDVGANIGAVSVPLWSKVGLSGKVISVEADPRNIDRIRANLKLNSYPENYVVNIAITDRKGTLKLRCYPECNGWQTIGNPRFAKDYDYFIQDIRSIDFNELVKDYDLRSIDLVKIDVEGAEILVLSGMKSFLKQKKIGCIIFEVNNLTLEGMGLNVSQLMSFWDEFDYTLWRLDDTGTPVVIKGNWPEHLIGDCIAFPR